MPHSSEQYLDSGRPGLTHLGPIHCLGALVTTGLVLFSSVLLRVY